MRARPRRFLGARLSWSGLVDRRRRLWLWRFEVRCRGVDTDSHDGQGKTVAAAAFIRGSTASGRFGVAEATSGAGRRASSSGENVATGVRRIAALGSVPVSCRVCFASDPALRRTALRWSPE
jgi:hypothetical protein